MVETVIVLKPKSEWREGLTRDELMRELDEKLRYPGMPNGWWMPIQTRTEMLATGIRSSLGIQVVGDDVAVLERTAVEIEHAVRKIPGTVSAFAERSSGGFFLDVTVKRDELVRHGLRVEDVLGVVDAIGGRVVSTAVDGRARYAITLRYGEPLDNDPQRLGQALVKTPAGGQVALAQVADLKFVTGPATIYSEGGKLVMVVVVYLAPDQAIVDYVAEAKQVVRDQVALPNGVRIEWAGQFKNFERMWSKLEIVLPLTLVIIFLLLYLSTRSLAETAIVLLAIPFSLIGAVWMLWFLDYHLSVAVAVGLIALAGLDAQTGVVMLLYLRMSHDTRERADQLRTEAELDDAIVEGAARRVRPKVMTVLTMLIGLLPLLFSTGAGADVMRRIAAPMVGGLITSFLLELTVYPAIYAVWKRRVLRRRAARD
jgi:copper/silver efflux system protein